MQPKVFPKSSMLGRFVLPAPAGILIFQDVLDFRRRGKDMGKVFSDKPLEASC